MAYFDDLVSLATQALRVDNRIHLEMSQVGTSHFLDKVPTKLSQSQLRLFRNLWISQTNFLSQAGTNIPVKYNEEDQGWCNQNQY